MIFFLLGISKHPELCMHRYKTLKFNSPNLVKVRTIKYRYETLQDIAVLFIPPLRLFIATVTIFSVIRIIEILLGDHLHMIPLFSGVDSSILLLLISALVLIELFAFQNRCIGTYIRPLAFGRDATY